MADPTDIDKVLSRLYYNLPNRRAVSSVKVRILMGNAYKTAPNRRLEAVNSLCLPFICVRFLSLSVGKLYSSTSLQRQTTLSSFVKCLGHIINFANHSVTVRCGVDGQAGRFAQLGFDLLCNLGILL